MKIPELAGAVQGSGIINDMIVDMCPIVNSSFYKEIPECSLEKPQERMYTSIIVTGA